MESSTPLWIHTAIVTSFIFSCSQTAILDKVPQVHVWKWWLFSYISHKKGWTRPGRDKDSHWSTWGQLSTIWWTGKLSAGCLVCTRHTSLVNEGHVQYTKDTQYILDQITFKSKRYKFINLIIKILNIYCFWRGIGIEIICFYLPQTLNKDQVNFRWQK